MAFSFELKLAIFSELYGAISAGPEHRRTSSFEQLKKYLEENADEWIEW